MAGVFNIRIKPVRARTMTEWWSDPSNTLELARKLTDEGHILDTEEMLRFFEKPWKWTEEWAHANKAYHEPEHCVFCQEETGG
jgi:hypothetical protein